MIKKILARSLCAFGVLFTFGQQTDETATEYLDEVVITDTRFNLKKENSGKTVVVISRKEIEQSKGKTLANLINSKSGITINGSTSNAGQNLSTFVRGGQNRQVLVLVDGIAVSDPSQIENNFDLQLLALDQIERIEILKGASSALYGNRASTAVINVILKKPERNKIKLNFSSMVGTNNGQNDKSIDVAEFNNTIGVNGSINKLGYIVNFSNRFVDGLSAIKSNNEDQLNNSDAFSKYNLFAKLNYQFTTNLSLSAFGTIDRYNAEYDESFGFLDADYLSTNRQNRVGLSPKYKYKKGSVTINFGYTDVEREFESSFPARFEAKSFVIDAFNKYRLSDVLFTVVGLNYVRTEMDSFSIPFGGNTFVNDISSDAATDNIFDPYLNLTYTSNFGFNLNSGIRLNNHSEYGNHLVYNVNPSYNFKINGHHFKLLSSYSTAFITPSLFQLFAPGFGNENLEPQEDRTIEGGMTWHYKNLKLSIVYFNRDQKNTIDYVVTDPYTFEGEYQNLNSTSEVQGVEIELSLRFGEKVDLQANYTFTELKEGFLFRIPKHKVNTRINYSFLPSTMAFLAYRYNSDRTSPFFNDDFTANRILSSYQLIDLGINHELIKDRMRIFFNVDNLLNEDYEELYRFSTLGRNYKFGFSLNF